MEHALTILHDAELPAAIAGARADLHMFAPVIEDREEGRGPLAGICSALQSSDCRWAVFLTVDMPLLPAPLLDFLLQIAIETDAAAVVASLVGFTHTFPAVLDRGLLGSLAERLKEGNNRCLEAIQEASSSLGKPMIVVDLEKSIEYGSIHHPLNLPLPSWFLNANYPDDLPLVEECFAGKPREGVLRLSPRKRRS
jgi:molybdopterin-guanine dinucleotide biosynthesis protein A